MLHLDLIYTLAFAGLALFLGQAVVQRIPLLDRSNIPAPVVGGLLVACVTWALRSVERMPFSFDTTLQSPLMIAFFTSLGFGASLRLLRQGGPQVLLLLLASTVLAALQNVVGVVLAIPMGQHPLFGVLNGSVTMAGGPGTGMAFAKLFEDAGVAGAGSIAIAAAMAGILAGGLVGGPVATYLVHRHRLTPARTPLPAAAETPGASLTAGEGRVLLKSLVLLLVAMWLGSWVSQGFAAVGFTLPAYIGAMIVASVLRNVDDKTGWLGISMPVVDALGSAGLSLFLVLALMTLHLWELGQVALPMLVILVAQVVLMVVVSATLTFRLLGKDYDSAVMAGGLCGFMLGTSANAMANMEAMVQKYGPAPRAFLVVPMVGACFIDFANAVLITACVNLLK